MHDEYRRSRAANPGRRKISEIKKAMKSQGFTPQEIVRNLDYLVQTRWIIREEERYPVMGGRRPVMAKQLYFKISDKGVDYKAGPSKFQNIERYEGINVSAVGSVVVVGGNNIVNASYAELYGALGILAESVKASDKLRCLQSGGHIGRSRRRSRASIWIVEAPARHLTLVGHPCRLRRCICDTKEW